MIKEEFNNHTVEVQVMTLFAELGFQLEHFIFMRHLNTCFDTFYCTKNVLKFSINVTPAQHNPYLHIINYRLLLQLRAHYLFALLPFYINLAVSAQAKHIK